MVVVPRAGLGIEPREWAGSPIGRLISSEQPAPGLGVERRGFRGRISFCRIALLAVPGILPEPSGNPPVSLWIFTGRKGKEGNGIWNPPGVLPEPYVNPKIPNLPLRTGTVRSLSTFAKVSLREIPGA
jgi:hypothetical protein